MWQFSFSVQQVENDVKCAFGYHFTFGLLKKKENSENENCSNIMEYSFNGSQRNENLN